MATQDFTIREGDTKVLTVTVRNQNTREVVSIAGATILWKAFKGYGKTVALSKSGSITDGAGGVFTVTIAAGDTAGFRGSYNHEAQVTFADSTVCTVLTGVMNVERGFN
jgi:hypothetical protein